MATRMWQRQTRRTGRKLPAPPIRRLKAAHDPRARTAADHRQAVDAICQQLLSAGWTIDRRESDAQHLSVTAIIDVDLANAHLDRTASDLDKALRIFQR